MSGWDPSKFTPPPNPFANVGSAITAGGTVVNALRGAQAAAPAAAGAAAGAAASGSTLGKLGNFLGGAGAIPVVGGIVQGVTGWLQARAQREAAKINAIQAQKAADQLTLGSGFNRNMQAQENQQGPPNRRVSNPALQYQMRNTGAIEQGYFDEWPETWDPNYVRTAEPGFQQRLSMAQLRQANPEIYNRDAYMSSQPSRDTHMVASGNRGGMNEALSRNQMGVAGAGARRPMLNRPGIPPRLPFSDSQQRMSMDAWSPERDRVDLRRPRFDDQRLPEGGDVPGRPRGVGSSRWTGSMDG